MVLLVSAYPQQLENNPQHGDRGIVGCADDPLKTFRGSSPC